MAPKMWLAFFLTFDFGNGRFFFFFVRIFLYFILTGTSGDRREK
jgi:hypothetical protein